MGVFLVLLIVPLFLQHIVVKGFYINYQERNKKALEFFFLMLTLLIMLRHERVGNDTRNYIRFFKQYAEINWGSLHEVTVEVSFAYFNKLVSLFSKEPRFYLAVSAIVVSALIYPTYKRLCMDASLTIVLFSILSTFVMMFSGIRQMLAICVGFVAYDFTRNRKLIHFAVTVLLAITIHTSAFMLAFMYPLYHAKITKKWLLALIPAMVVCFIFNEPIFSVLAMILERYTAYEAEITSTGAYTMLVLFALFTIFSFLIPDEKKLDQETIGLRTFLLMSLTIQMFAPLHTLAMRMSYYYIVFIPLLLPRIIANRRKRWAQSAVIARHLMVLFFFFYFFLSARGGALNVFPYYFFWENVR